MGGYPAPALAPILHANNAVAGMAGSKALAALQKFDYAAGKYSVILSIAKALLLMRMFRCARRDTIKDNWENAYDPPSRHQAG
jgi:hypothetical protein